MHDDTFVTVAKALADPTRRRMLRELRKAGGGGLTCSCMLELFPLSQPTISHHVRTLEAAGLVSVEKSGQFHLLSVNEKLLAEFAADLSGGPVKPASRGGARRARSVPGSKAKPAAPRAARPRRRS